MTRSNVAILIQTFSGGGAERVASNLSLCLADNIFKKHVLLYENKIDYEHKGSLINLGCPSGRNLAVKLKSLILKVYRLRKKKIELKLDAVISFTEDPNIINILSRVSEKVIISVHISPCLCYKNLRGGIFRLLIRLLYNKADLIVTVSEGIKYDLVNNFGIDKDKIRVIYNMLNIEAISSLSVRDLNDNYNLLFDNHKIIITAGRLTKQKGQWHLIRFFQEIKKNINKSKLILLGDGELRHYLISLSKDLGFKAYSIWGNAPINENYDIYFLGFQNNPFNLISKAQIFILSSLFEGFSNVLVEAMACGLPIISSDCRSGPREILAPNTNFRHETKSPEFSKYGILMPVFDGHLYGPKNQLTDEEKIWANITVQALKDEDMQKHYSLAGITRANDFTTTKIINEWTKLLT